MSLIFTFFFWVFWKKIEMGIYFYYYCWLWILYNCICTDPIYGCFRLALVTTIKVYQLLSVIFTEYWLCIKLCCGSNYAKLCISINYFNCCNYYCACLDIHVFQLEIHYACLWGFYLFAPIIMAERIECSCEQLKWMNKSFFLVCFWIRIKVRNRGWQICISSLGV